MDRDIIISAVQKAKKGIGQYVEIMDLLGRVDVSKSPEFQKKFNAFYRIRQRPATWYECYYSFLQESKNAVPSFNQTIEYFNVSLGRYEPSFSSKLVATLNPNKPIWDIYIIENTGHKAPAYTDKHKIKLAKEIYASIEGWYENFIKSNIGKLYVQVFDDIVPEHNKITTLKKIDFILWQIRH